MSMDTLTADEIEALKRAGSWYASYFSAEIAGEADEDNGYAVEERRAYLDLVAALRKLGVLFPVPDALRRHADQAA